MAMIASSLSFGARDSWLRMAPNRPFHPFA